MNSNLKVSIITVVFNGEQHISSAIESVINQDYQNIEYIIIDGGSTDNTKNIISRYKNKIDKYVSEPDNGIYDAMNKGIELSSGEIICILNSDDEYSGQHVISKIVKAFLENPNKEAILSNISFFSENKSSRKFFRLIKGSQFKRWQLKYGFMPPHPGIFFRKSVHDTYGIYNTDYKIASDYDFCLRVFLIGNIDFLKIDMLTIYMREGGVSTSGLTSITTITHEIVQSLKKNGIYVSYIKILLRIPIKLFYRLFK